MGPRRGRPLARPRRSPAFSFSHLPNYLASPRPGLALFPIALPTLFAIFIACSPSPVLFCFPCQAPELNILRPRFVSPCPCSSKAAHHPKPHLLSHHTSLRASARSFGRASMPTYPNPQRSTPSGTSHSITNATMRCISILEPYYGAAKPTRRCGS